MTENPALEPNKDDPKDSEKNGFLETLPEELRNEELFQDIEDVGQLAQKTYELGGRVWNLTAGQPVRPDTVDEYEVVAPAGMPQEEALIKGFKETAFKIGMTQEQVSAVTSLWNSWVRDRMEQQSRALHASADKAAQATETGLRDLWKSDYGQNMDKVLQVLRAFGSEEFKAELNQSGRSNSIFFTQFLHRIHSAMSEDAFVEGDPAPPKRMRLSKGGIPVLSFPSMENRT
jgi:hypothetical protein